jgi:MOSC domain-containing protein YiiM
VIAVIARVMKLVSVNVGRPRAVSWRGEQVMTGIYKAPVTGRVTLRTLNLDGDGQADLTVHGGAAKAVYCYPLQHYEFWQRELARDLTLGMFGENFTIEGGDEDSVHIGDEFTIGSGRVVVTQPRLPCYKLGIRFESDQMVKRFLAAGRSGFYVAVLEEGQVGAGDAVELVARHAAAVRVSEITRLYVTKTYTAADRAVIERALQIPSLPDSWKDYFREQRL